MKSKLKIEILLKLENSRIRSTIVNALIPEIISPPTEKVKSKLITKNDEIHIIMESTSPSMLRASFNSNMRLIIAILNTIKALRSK